MLLCFANACGGVFEEAVDLSGDVAFEAALGFSGGFAFGGSFGDVGLGVWAVAALTAMVCSARLSWRSPRRLSAVAGVLPGRSFEWGDAARRANAFVAAAAGV